MLLILEVNYIEGGRNKATKSCLCHRTVTVVMECNKTISNYLNIIRSSNNCGLIEYWNPCFTEFSKFTYVHYFFNAR